MARRSVAPDGIPAVYLGLHNDVDGGAAAWKDGRFVAAAQEERFTRRKNQAGWPSQSIDYVLAAANVRPENVDRVVYAMFQQVEPTVDQMDDLLSRTWLGQSSEHCPPTKYAERICSEISHNARLFAELTTECRRLGWLDRLRMVDHHFAHAAAAYATSPFRDGLTFVCDGKGSFQSSTCWDCRDGRLRLLSRATTFDSVGYFFGTVTRLLGFNPQRDEGKVAGLAAHGDWRVLGAVTDGVLGYDGTTIRATLGDLYLPWFCGPHELPRLAALFARHRREDVAAAAQATIEGTVCAWIDDMVRRSGRQSSAVAVAGGVFGNVRLNEQVARLDRVEALWVLPMMGDMGIPYAGIQAQLLADGCNRPDPLDSVFLGPGFSPDAVRETVEAMDGETLTRTDPLAAMLAEFERGEPVALFQGRMEYGPRALGNRSLLYHCRDTAVGQWLNDRLRRSEFMPFAPAVPIANAAACFVGWTAAHLSAEFMTITYPCTPLFRERCPAAVHVDGTARPQVVSPSRAPEFHELLSRFCRTTGDLAVLNTSFNNHNEPIVCSVPDAVRSLRRAGIRVMLTPPYVFRV